MLTEKSRIVAEVSPASFDKITKLKKAQGFEAKTFGEWLSYMAQGVNLQSSDDERIQEHTKDGLLEMWLQNLAHNLPAIWEGETLAGVVPAISKQLEAEGKDPDQPISGASAVVIGRGPSLYANNHLKVLAESGYKGTLVVSDGALRDALNAGVVPSDYRGFYVVTVDGSREKIWKLYDDPLVDKYGPDIKAIICSFAAPNVAERLKKANAKVHWFHPIFDDFRELESFTRFEQYVTKCEKHPNGVPCLVAGGNAGAACWILSWLIFRTNPVALIGMDLGYRPEDDLTKTYYWDGMMQGLKGNAVLVRSQYTTIHNPETNLDCIQDPVFKHYRNSFLEMLQVKPRWQETLNCTEGGSLFGEGVTTMKFADFLEAHHS